MPGGRIAPDGRPAQAPGVGKTSKRHDLEQPKTPGLAGSDLQQGDVQRLEQAQQVAPITDQGPATPDIPQGGGAATGTRPESPEDAIQYLGGRLKKGTIPRATQGPERLDLGQWVPLLQELVRNPNRSGPLANALITQIGNYANSAASGRVRVVDENALQESLTQGQG